MRQVDEIRASGNARYKKTFLDCRRYPHASNLNQKSAFQIVGHDEPDQVVLDWPFEVGQVPVRQSV